MLFNNYQNLFIDKHERENKNHILASFYCMGYLLINTIIINNYYNY